MQQKSVAGVREEGLHIQSSTWQVMWEHAPWSPELLGRSERAGERKKTAQSLSWSLHQLPRSHTHTPTPPATLPGYSHLDIPTVLSSLLVQFCYSSFPLTSTPEYGSTKYNQTEIHCRKMHKAQPTP